tara:strand:- start:232 stop:417 length:186 start_codon:yes stop_codon:yes gene_type:complete
MITRYRIIDTSDKEVEILNSVEEALQYIEAMRQQQPHVELRYEPIQTSNVKPGFGRDPELH